MNHSRQCKAKSKRTGERCKKYAMRGREVCRNHGGIIGGKKATEARSKAPFKHGAYSREESDRVKQIPVLIKSLFKSE